MRYNKTLSAFLSTESKGFKLLVLGEHIHVMRGSRNFCQGGGPGQSDKKAIIYHFSRVPEGVQHFPGGGVQLFPGGGGVQLLIPYRNPYIL